MQCPRHPRNQVIGYCFVCGDFGCKECLNEHENQLYCPRDYRPIAEVLERKKRHKESLSRPERQRLVVRKMDGSVLTGVCFALNPGADGFHLDLVDRTGQPTDKSSYIPFNDLKGVFYVKSFDGKFNKEQRFPHNQTVGKPMVVVFKDGEVMTGYTVHSYTESSLRFYLIPDDPDSNNISVLVERKAVTGVYSPDEFKRIKQREIEDFIRSHPIEGATKEELHGDYHFHRHEYVRALKYYRMAQREDPDSIRVRKKIIMAQYNIGVRYIKHHEYDRALACMEMVLEMDPDNERAQHKIEQLREHLAKHRRHRRHSSSPVIGTPNN
jgi:tetratricopeptide (TPR) repeat protein